MNGPIARRQQWPGPSFSVWSAAYCWLRSPVLSQRHVPWHVAARLLFVVAMEGGFLVAQALGP
ncbi:MAG TPA: hypothetical protein VKI99_08340 [Candidatus Dormibacteraeota bacterium]|nr:hypothetical protein [Candidatus Dormibacteraeota bacterium]